MEDIKREDVVNALGNLTVLELIALTRKLEEQWGVKAEPPAQVLTMAPQTDKQAVEQTEFTVMLTSVPADKKMSVIKAVREVMALGLKESKELVEAAPKMIKDSLSKEEADHIKNKLTEAGAVVEMK